MLTIAHTHAGRTMIDSTSWGRSISAWFVPA